MTNSIPKASPSTTSTGRKGGGAVHYLAPPKQDTPNVAPRIAAQTEAMGHESQYVRDVERAMKRSHAS